MPRLIRILALTLCLLGLAGCASRKLPQNAPPKQVATQVMNNDLKTLWVIDLNPLSAAEQTLAVTLQGLTANGESAIWIKDGGMNAILLNDLRKEGVTIHETSSVWELLATFREQVKGVIVYKLETDSINVATSLCGPFQAVAVDESLMEKAQAEGLAVLLDMRGYDEARAFAEYKDRFTRGILVEQAESKNAHLRDFAVARNLFTYYGVSKKAQAQFLTDLGPNPLVFGWGGDEHAWVEQISTVGGAGIAADWSRNLSVLERLPVALPARPHPSPMLPKKEGERIVAFVMSDGDNIQWMGGGFVTDKGFWASRYRGDFNMTWEMAPILSEVAPRVLAHFYATASDRWTPLTASDKAIDDFIVGPSGAGYSFHNDLPDRRVFAETTARLMRQTDLSIVTMLNSDGGMEQSVELLEQPEVLGVIYKDYSPYNAKGGRIFWHNGKPCVSYRYLLWEPKPANSPEGVAAAIATLPASPWTDPNSYALINVHAWSFKDMGGPMEAVKRTIDLLPPNTRVVTAEEFIILLRQLFGEPVQPGFLN